MVTWRQSQHSNQEMEPPGYSWEQILGRDLEAETGANLGGDGGRDGGGSRDVCGPARP